MPLRNEQQLTIAEVLNLKGVHFTPCSLAIPAQLEDEALPMIARRVCLVRGFSRWALGAVLCEMVARRSRPGFPPDLSWANDCADTLQLDPKERREVMAVHAFYPSAMRFTALTYEHHREAMWHADDGAATALRTALAYLQHAAKEHLDVPKLRAHMRRASTTERVEVQTESPAITAYNAVFDFRRWAVMQLASPESLTKERAAIILTDLGEGVALIDRLRAMAG